MSKWIDADALNDAMYHEAFENDDSYNERNPMAKWDSGLWIRYKMFENAIDEAPTIEPKSGEWLKFGLGRGTRILFCTHCERKIEVPLSQGDSNYDFCPNCGCRMKGADDEKL